MNVRVAEKETRRWYILYRGEIPNVGTKEYAKFAGRSLSLVHSIAGDKARDYKVTVDQDSPTAYINMTGKMISIPAWYLDREAVLKVNEDITDVNASAVTLLNGSVVHETFHLMHTPPTLTELLDSTKRASELYKKYGQSANDVANIIEDLYIESLARSNKYSQFIAGKNAILFSQANFELTIKKWMDNPTSLIEAIHLAVFYKNESFRSNSVWSKLPSRAHNALKAASLSSYGQPVVRANYAIDFLESFELSDADRTPASSSQSIDGSEAVESEGSKMAASEGEKSSSKTKSSMKSEFESEANEALEEADSMIKFSEHGDNFYKIICEDIDSSVSGYSGKRVEIPTNFAFLNNLLRLRTKNHAPGEAKVRGSKIVNTRVYRISTDGKMFSNQNSRSDKMERVEIIILVDASASTRYSRGGYGTADLLSIEASNAEAIHKALRKVGIANSVYAHTSVDGKRVGDDRNQPVLYHISSYDMKTTTSNYEDKFSKLLNISASENYDGYAIEMVSKKFTSRPSKKLLIVLSDGAPSGPGYSGSSANQHTKEVIAKLRKSGIGVICMSLVTSVIRNNNEIYGQKNNIDATQNIQKEFERIITNLQQEI